MTCVLPAINYVCDSDPLRVVLMQISGHCNFKMFTRDDKRRDVDDDVVVVVVAPVGGWVIPRVSE